MKNNINNWSKIVNILAKKNLTIATMESCTGGAIANEITNISGASSILKESYITYSNEAKIKQGVPKEIIKKYTVYSQETAIAMAKAVKEKTGSSIGIGVTGQLGRLDPNNQVGNINCVWFAIVDENDKVLVKKVIVPNVERKNQKQSVINEIAISLLENV